MKLLRGGDLHYLEGKISHCRRAQRVLRLRVGGREVSLADSSITRNFHNGDVVRMLVRDSSRAPVAKLLAWQRRRVHYAGMPVSVVAVLVGASSCGAAALLQNTWLALAGVTLLVLQLVFAARRAWVVHLFNTFGRAYSREQQAYERALPVEERASPAEEPAAPVEAPSMPLEASPSPVAETPLEVPLDTDPGSVGAPMSRVPAEILEFTHDAIIIWEMEGAGIVYWNRAAEQLYGYTREEAYGRVSHELLETQLAGGLGELQSRLARYGLWVGELCHTRSDGRRVEVEARLSLMSQEHRPWLVLEVNRDVTDRNRAEAARQAMEQQLARLREHTPA